MKIGDRVRVVNWSGYSDPVSTLGFTTGLRIVPDIVGTLGTIFQVVVPCRWYAVHLDGDHDTGRTHVLFGEDELEVVM